MGGAIDFFFLGADDELESPRLHPLLGAVAGELMEDFVLGRVADLSMEGRVEAVARATDVLGEPTVRQGPAELTSHPELMFLTVLCAPWRAPEVPAARAPSAPEMLPSAPVPSFGGNVAAPSPAVHPQNVAPMLRKRPWWSWRSSRWTRSLRVSGWT